MLFPGEGRKESFRTLACGVMALEEEGGEKGRRKKEAGGRRPGYVSAFFPGGTDTRKTGSKYPWRSFLKPAFRGVPFRPRPLCGKEEFEH